MLRRVFVCSAACAAFALVFAPAAPAAAALTLNATWVVSYYSDPSDMPYATQCVNFVPTGHADGIVTGQFNSPTQSGWTGTWVQKGEHFSWYGTFAVSGVTYATFDTGDLLAPAIAAEPSAGAFDVANGATLFSGTATLAKVKKCPPSGARLGPPELRTLP